MISQRWINYRQSLNDDLIGGSKMSGYVQRMEYEKKIAFDKIHNPSKYMINKYGNKRLVEEQDEGPTYDDSGHDNHDDYVEREPEYDDINVAKPKKIKKKVDKAQPTEVEEERIEKKRREEEIQKGKFLLTYDKLKQMIVEYKRADSKLDQEYKNQLSALKSKRGITKVKKDDIQQLLIKKIHSDINALKAGQYKPIFDYMKTHKLKFEMVYKHINIAMKKL